MFCLYATRLAAQSNDWKNRTRRARRPGDAQQYFRQPATAVRAANVRQQSIVISDDGVEHAAAIVYPDSPSRRLAVVWGEGAEAVHPDFVIICYRQGNSWPVRAKIADGITMGTTLRTLETLNGGLFRIAGFG